MKRRKKEPTLADHINESNISHLNFSRYTYKSWKKCYPESNREEYEDRQVPWDCMEFLQDIYEQAELYKVFDQDITIRQILIDEDYFSWLEKTGKENSEQARLEYINNIADPKKSAEQIAKKKLDTAFYAYLIPLTGIVHKTSFNAKISWETANMVREYIKELIGDTRFSVWVSPYIFNPYEIEENFDRICNIAEVWVNEGKKIVIREFETQEFDEGEDGPYVVCMYLPVFVYEKISGEVSLREISEAMGILEAENASELDYRNLGRFLDTATQMPDFYDYQEMPSVDQSDAAAALSKDLKSSFDQEFGVIVHPFLVSAYEAEEYYEEFVEQVEK